MKTIDDFYNKYGTGKNYEDLFQIILHAKHSSDNFLKERYEEMKNDFEDFFRNDFDEFLWRDYQYLLSY